MNKIIIAEQKGSVLSKEQKQFNRLNSQIIKQKRRLSSLQDDIVSFKVIYADKYLPLQHNLNQLKINMVYLLDEAYDSKIFTKNDRKKMRYIIDSIAQELASVDEKVKHIYNKRCNGDFDEEQTLLNEFITENFKSAISQEFDIDLDHINMDNEEEFIREFTKSMHEKFEADEGKKAKRKKSPHLLKKEAEIAQKEQEASKSIKEVYRQLAKMLHPDREEDITEQERKTKLMQKLNVAYDKQDLLTMLQLQLEIEQIDQDSINSISLEKIKHYNMVLKKQLEEIKQEIEFVWGNFQIEFNLSDSPVLASPDAMMFQVNIEMEQMRRETQHIQSDLEMFKDKEKLKNGLRSFTF